MNSKVFPLALKRISLNYSFDVPVHIILNISHGVIGLTYIIQGSTSLYIVIRIIITSRGLFLIRSSFYGVLLPKGVPACFEFAPIPKCAVLNWRLTKLPLYCRLWLICRQKSSTSFSAMRQISFLPLRNQIVRGVTVQQSLLYLWVL